MNLKIFGVPTRWKKKEIIQNFQEKSRIFEISVATIFVTIGSGNVKKPIENKLNSTSFFLFRKTYKKTYVSDLAVTHQKKKNFNFFSKFQK